MPLSSRSPFRPGLPRRLPRVAALGCGLCLAVAAAQADDWALGGLDVVEMQQGEDLPGRPDLATRWRGEIWLFTDEANRVAFEADPRSYAPEFDGTCPVSLAKGKPVPGNPALAVSIDGRLYLPASEEARRLLIADPDGILGQAEAQANAQGGF